MHMCVYMECTAVTKLVLGVFFEHFLLSLLRQGTLLNVRLTSFCGLASQIALWSSSSVPALSYRRLPCLPGSYVGSGDQKGTHFIP